MVSFFQKERGEAVIYGYEALGWLNRKEICRTKYTPGVQRGGKWLLTPSKNVPYLDTLSCTLATCMHIVYTVNSPNNGHFGARPTVRYSGGVLYWGIIIVNTVNVSCSKFIANIVYMGRANISQGYESTSSL